ncbi:MAG: OmpA family protein [Deltaproteobacteria bacterium]|nr:OmpA family protein [Deltaproteobacteria bacterium]
MSVNRKKNRNEGPPADVGMTMTVSLFLILLTFFILLNSIAVLDQQKARIAIGSLTGAFGNLLGGLSPMKTGEDIIPPSPAMISEPVTLKELISMTGKDMIKHVKIQEMKDREIITIKKSALFYDDRLEIKPSSRELLDRLCEFINKGQYPVEIVGHTDNVPAAEKGYRSNWEISGLVALEVLRYMIQRGRVTPRRLTAYGSGSYRPIASNETMASRAKNRRVDIILNINAPPYIRRIYGEKPSGVVTYKEFDFKVF